VILIAFSLVQLIESKELQPLQDLIATLMGKEKAGAGGASSSEQKSAAEIVAAEFD
jgi:peptide subunit release factor 1 (eRF1)